MADEIRALHRGGVQVAALARRFGVAKSSISAILHLHVYVPEYVVMLSLAAVERGLLTEIARDESMAEEQLASALLSRAIQDLAVHDDIREALNARH